MYLVGALLSVIDLLINILVAIFIVQMVLSLLVAFNVVNTYNEFVRRLMEALYRVTEPLLRPIRRFMPDLGGLDFSPMVLILGLVILQKLLAGMAYQVAYGG
ncbi:MULTISPECIES: YggT family protein [Edaphosphingomonas]|uniref:YggT family protein n=2 Tax=Edaphosphingomonas TaxID=3423724 RepID=A0A2T4HJT0_9SPHN|nr:MULTISPECIES: YggT family protein [Sphingomonas]MDX3885941.1 YggT family protein [Sphingomonas sp.]OHT22011.1 YGGT family protein [Sphingomonas haloaromaticamans]PTD16054.1 YggT family protein [Sphingomonas fennica]